MIRNQQVLGSSPSAGSTLFNDLRGGNHCCLCRLVTTGHRAGPPTRAAPNSSAYLHSRSRFFRIRPRRTSRIRREPDSKRPLMVSVFCLSPQDT